MSRLILVRHGNTFDAHQVPVQIGARTDLPLTEMGRRQIEETANYLQLEGFKPDLIYAGPLKRQEESGRILSQKLGAPLLAEPALVELDYGPWEGLSAKEISRLWPKESAEWAEGIWQPHIFKGCLPSLQEWLEQLRRKPANYLAVTSNGIFRLLGLGKVGTGHFCELNLEGGLTVCGYDTIRPSANTFPSEAVAEPLPFWAQVFR